MSEQTQESIAEKLAKLLNLVSPQENPTTATVKSINEDEGTCICVTTLRKENYKVRLVGSFNSDLLIIPKIKSQVIINFLDNMRTKCYVESYSEIDKIIFKNDSKIDIQIKNRDTYITLSPDKIKIKGMVEIEGDLNCTGEVTAMSETMPVLLSTHKQAGPAGPPVPG